MTLMDSTMLPGLQLACKCLAPGGLVTGVLKESQHEAASTYGIHQQCSYTSMATSAGGCICTAGGRLQLGAEPRTSAAHLHAQGLQHSQGLLPLPQLPIHLQCLQQPRSRNFGSLQLTWPAPALPDTLSAGAPGRQWLSGKVQHDT